jgi:hypothetical protein
MVTTFIDDILELLHKRLVTNRQSQQMYRAQKLLIEEATSRARGDAYENAINDVLAIKKNLYGGDVLALKEIQEYWEAVKNGDFLKKIKTNATYGKAYEKVEAFYGGRYVEGKGFQPLEKTSVYPVNPKTAAPKPASCPNCHRSDGLRPNFNITKWTCRSPACMTARENAKCKSKPFTGPCCNICGCALVPDGDFLTCPHPCPIPIPHKLPPCPHTVCRNGICVACYHDKNFREFTPMAPDFPACRATFTTDDVRTKNS